MEAIVCINCGSTQVKGKQFLCFKCKQEEKKQQLDSIDVQTARAVKYNQDEAAYMESLTRRYR